MKTTDHFKNTLEAYLRNRAETDELFAIHNANEYAIFVDVKAEYSSHNGKFLN